MYRYSYPGYNVCFRCYNKIYQRFQCAYLWLTDGSGKAKVNNSVMEISWLLSRPETWMNATALGRQPTSARYEQVCHEYACYLLSPFHSSSLAIWSWMVHMVRTRLKRQSFAEFVRRERPRWAPYPSRLLRHSSHSFSSANEIAC